MEAEGHLQELFKQHHSLLHSLLPSYVAHALLDERSVVRSGSSITTTQEASRLCVASVTASQRHGVALDGLELSGSLTARPYPPEVSASPAAGGLGNGSRSMSTR